jgi:hypothetical protein
MGGPPAPNGGGPRLVPLPGSVDERPQEVVSTKGSSPAKMSRPEVRKATSRRSTFLWPEKAAGPSDLSTLGGEASSALHSWWMSPRNRYPADPHRSTWKDGAALLPTVRTCTLRCLLRYPGGVAPERGMPNRFAAHIPATARR